jgi:cell division protein FtsQ
VWRAARWVGPGMGCAALIVWGIAALMASDFLRVRDVTVVGNRRLSAGAVESLVAGLRQDHILRVNLEDYRRRLLDSSWVDDVHLTRVLPATIQISVIERTPIAVARLDQHLYLVDEAGSIIDDYGPQYQEFDLPVVDGLMVEPKTGAPEASPDRARLAASLLDALGQKAEIRDRVSQINVSNPRDAVVMFDDDAAWLHLGDRRFTERLQQYVELRPRLIEQFGPLDYVDLRFDERVFLRSRQRAGLRQIVSK